ncbi:T-cell activation Rho GTPase-activating protein-like isoform X2 [Corvus hawaiiensis]|uniref:T-cell activation Rho GTPase-activating protein-like isoform X2 n=1 Tax=Corvus hawaiiensis TaxID=134902 RepID=UPI002018E9A6|nr:T-cell activation Rho GTPase-activating protein-like isoform X2 [Corvus hawaiiensis]
MPGPRAGGSGVPAPEAPLKTVPSRRCSAPSLLFSKGLSKPWLPSASSREVKELWLDSLLGQTKGLKETRVSRAPPIKLLMKVLSSCNTSKTLNAGNMESLIECQTEDDTKKCPLSGPADTEDGLCLSDDGTKKRKKVISQSFTLRRSLTKRNSSGQLDSGAKITLFGQPLALICGEDDTLPQPVQDLLAILYMKGPSTEGIFRKAANEKARKELKEDLNKGGNVDLKSKAVHLLAVVLKDFLRNIPSKLLSDDLYEKWMQALEKPNKQEKIEELKEVADKLPRPNLVLLKHLLSLLHHISQNAETNRMDSSNLAICIGPNMLSPGTDNALPLEVQKEMNNKVRGTHPAAAPSLCGSSEPSTGIPLPLRKPNRTAPRDIGGTPRLRCPSARDGMGQAAPGLASSEQKQQLPCSPLSHSTAPADFACGEQGPPVGTVTPGPSGSEAKAGAGGVLSVLGQIHLSAAPGLIPHRGLTLRL